MLVAAGLVDVVVLQEHGGRQHHVGHPGGLGQKLLVHADEQVVAREPALDPVLVGRDRDRIGVLDEQRRDRRTAGQRIGIAAQDRADARLIEHPHRPVADVRPFDHRLVPVIDVGVVVERPAPFVLPRAGNRRDAARRMHVGSAVARAREAVAEAEIGALGVAHQAGEFFDGRDVASRDGRGPLRRARAQMLLELARRIGVTVEIGAIGLVVAKQAMHHRAGERSVGAGPHQHGEIRLLHGGVHIDVDRDDLGAALLAGADRVGHDVDLGVDRVGAPDHDQIGPGHLARIRAGDLAGAGRKARIGGVHADGRMEAGIFLGVAQPVDAVAHHQPHGAGVVIRPDRLRAVTRFGRQQPLGDQVERVVP